MNADEKPTSKTPSGDRHISDSLLSGKVLPRRTFTHKGMNVSEYLVDWEPGLLKLIWVRDGRVEKVGEKGTKYPLFHHDVTSDCPENKAREEVERMYEAFYDYEVREWQALQDAAARGASGLSPRTDNESRPNRSDK